MIVSCIVMGGFWNVGVALRTQLRACWPGSVWPGEGSRGGAGGAGGAEGPHSSASLSAGLLGSRVLGRWAAGLGPQGAGER